MTIVAECKYALTGVGAAIAAGSHEWNGYCADLVNAPIAMHTKPTVTAVPAGGSARIADMLYVPAAWAMRTMPASIPGRRPT